MITITGGHGDFRSRGVGFELGLKLSVSFLQIAHVFDGQLEPALQIG